MTHREKVKACKAYQAKLAMLGEDALAKDLFNITPFEIEVKIAILAKVLGYPETLNIPNFVDMIR